MGARAQRQRPTARPGKPAEKPARRRARGRRGRRQNRTRGFRLPSNAGRPRSRRRRGLRSGALRGSLGCHVIGRLGRLLGAERDVPQRANELVLPATQLDDGAIRWTLLKKNTAGSHLLRCALVTHPCASSIGTTCFRCDVRYGQLLRSTWIVHVGFRIQMSVPRNDQILVCTIHYTDRNTVHGICI